MAFICQTAFAQTDKGIEYYEKEDYENAVKCFQQAAEQGDPTAQRNLANCYANGWGVPKDQEKANYWYKMAEDGE